MNSSYLPFAFRSDDLVEGTPAVHALLVGCSVYDAATQLSCAAITAFRLFQHLVLADEEGRLVAPLASVTLLLSPTKDEAAVLERCIPDEAWAEATHANILCGLDQHIELLANMERACVAPTPMAGAGMGMYYFCGHGFEGEVGDFVLPSDARRNDSVVTPIVNPRIV